MREGERGGIRERGEEREREREEERGREGERENRVILGRKERREGRR